jgi:hypothetical protein
MCVIYVPYAHTAVFCQTLLRVRIYFLSASTTAQLHVKDHVKLRRTPYLCKLPRLLELEGSQEALNHYTAQSGDEMDRD